MTLKDTHPYQIEIWGHLSDRRAGMFAGWQITFKPEGHTIISGAEIDQAALFGILIRIRDTGMPLISINRTDLQKM